MRLRCPVCYAEAALEAWVAEEEARALFGLLGQCPGGLGPALVGYLGLFRAPRRALGWGRALRLAQDVVAMEADAAVLTAALVETTEALRAKRAAGGDGEPLSSHRYLLRVLESTRARGVGPAAVGVPSGPTEVGAPGGRASATLRAARALEDLR